MIRILIVLVLLIAGFAVVFAPAALLRQLMPADAGVVLVAPSGTLWNGRADLVLGGRQAGNLSWRFDPVTILQGAVGYAVELSAPGQRLAGALRLRPDRFEALVDGTVSADYVNGWLTGYDIALGGDFALEAVQLELPWRPVSTTEPVSAAGRSAGRLHWSGGPVRYVLSGRRFEGTLPALEARFGEALQAVVGPAAQEDGGAPGAAAPAPLLYAELLANGYVRIGMTRRLTRMLNNPWPGTDADHEVVLEVEERLL